MDNLVLRVLWGSFNGLEDGEEEEEEEATILWGCAGKGKPRYTTCAISTFFRFSIPNVVLVCVILRASVTNDDRFGYGVELGIWAGPVRFI